MTESKMHPSQIDFGVRVTSLLENEPAMVSKMTAAIGLQNDEIPQMLAEVLKFLELIAWSGKRLTPSHKLDLAWHEFILFTATYTEYCNSNFNRFIHHHPGGTDQENQLQFRQTIRLYKLVFGPPNEHYWGELPKLGEPSSCGSCEG